MVVLFDIDETLIIDGKYPENYKKIKSMIKRLSQKAFIGICTSRAYNKEVKRIMNDYGIKGPIISENGSCIYKKKWLKYRLLKENSFDCNREVKKLIKKYFTLHKEKGRIQYLNPNKKNLKNIVINKDRKRTCTLRIPTLLKNEKEEIISFLKNQKELEQMIIVFDDRNDLKINIYRKDIDKISTIEKEFQGQEVIFITDFEILKLPIKDKNIKIYSVGNNQEFNKKCNRVYKAFGFGIEKILEELV